VSAFTLLTVIFIGTFVIVGVAVTGFVVFSRFLKKEKENADTFRAIHLDRPDKDEPKDEPK
jgi:hypothetical protein